MSHIITYIKAPLGRVPAGSPSVSLKSKILGHLTKVKNKVQVFNGMPSREARVERSFWREMNKLDKTVRRDGLIMHLKHVAYQVIDREMSSAIEGFDVLHIPAEMQRDYTKQIKARLISFTETEWAYLKGAKGKEVGATSSLKTLLRTLFDKEHLDLTELDQMIDRLVAHECEKSNFVTPYQLRQLIYRQAKAERREISRTIASSGAKFSRVRPDESSGASAQVVSNKINCTGRVIRKDSLLLARQRLCY